MNLEQALDIIKLGEFEYLLEKIKEACENAKTMPREQATVIVNANQVIMAIVNNDNWEIKISSICHGSERIIEYLFERLNPFLSIMETKRGQSVHTVSLPGSTVCSNTITANYTDLLDGLFRGCSQYVRGQEAFKIEDTDLQSSTSSTESFKISENNLDYFYSISNFYLNGNITIKVKANEDGSSECTVTCTINGNSVSYEDFKQICTWFDEEAVAKRISIIRASGVNISKIPEGLKSKCTVTTGGTTPVLLPESLQ